jgi:hypothetical protein
MRSILFDWMLEVFLYTEINYKVCSEFQMKRETLYLAFYYVDKFLSLESNVKNDEFQLLGLTAMYVACKMEEVYPIQTSDFLLSADNLYSLDQIASMELALYRKLDFHLTPTTA